MARAKVRPVKHGALGAPPRELRKWVEGERGSFVFRTASLEICVHGHIDYKDGTLFVSTRPDIGLGRRELVWRKQDIVNAQEQAHEIVLQYCRKMYEELLK